MNATTHRTVHPASLAARIYALKREIAFMLAKETRVREAIRLRQKTLYRLEASHALSEASRQPTPFDE
jgi:hypothetical protein